ncbi:glucosaminidase domain-containing protein [Odoribacter sp. OttesenSCG-928-G04]|nr:glucosaminidase domain-containing protein [Odoribacter sp. OttesenSCG-928-G04]
MKFTTHILFVVAFLFTTFSSYGESRQEFIKKYKHIAIREMQRTGIPASIKLAQGILESGCGDSDLSRKANNHFGIKCHKTWDGATFHQDDDERDECFRKYLHPEESWIDHSEFLTSRPRYASLFDLPCSDYKGWAKGLKQAGYATNPAYADLLIKIIEEEELYLYDDNTSGKKSPQREVAAKEVEKKPSANDRASATNYRKREEIRNGVLYIEAKPGDSFEKIARFYNIKLNKLLSYNDKLDTALKTGDYVYIGRKKSRAAMGYDFHRVKEGDNLYGISQYYGIKLKNLKKFNYLKENERLLEGEKIYLRSKSGV